MIQKLVTTCDNKSFRDRYSSTAIVVYARLVDSIGRSGNRVWTASAVEIRRLAA